MSSFVDITYPRAVLPPLPRLSGAIAFQPPLKEFPARQPGHLECSTSSPNRMLPRWRAHLPPAGTASTRRGRSRGSLVGKADIAALLALGCGVFHRRRRRGPQRSATTSPTNRSDTWNCSPDCSGTGSGGWAVWCRRWGSPAGCRAQAWAPCCWCRPCWSPRCCSRAGQRPHDGPPGQPVTVDLGGLLAVAIIVTVGNPTSGHSRRRWRSGPSSAPSSGPAWSCACWVRALLAAYRPAAPSCWDWCPDRCGGVRRPTQGCGRTTRPRAVGAGGLARLATSGWWCRRHGWQQSSFRAGSL